MITKKDRVEFAQYLKGLTDNQVRGALEKESTAGRRGYINLCEAELARRGLV